VSLECTARKPGPRLVMNVRLMSGRHPIWHGTYDGAMNDLPQMEDEIVTNVARALRVPMRKTPPPQQSGGTP